MSLKTLIQAVLDVPKNQEKGNDTHGSKVIVIPFDGAGGKPQRITFPEIANQPATLTELELNATTDSGLPVEYFVRSGPAEVAGHRLRFTPMPPRSHRPVEVKVVAYQWGRTIEPLVQSAEPVTRTFHLIAATTQQATSRVFTHPGLLHTRDNLDRMRRRVAAGDEA